MTKKAIKFNLFRYDPLSDKAALVLFFSPWKSAGEMSLRRQGRRELFWNRGSLAMS